MTVTSSRLRDLLLGLLFAGLMTWATDERLKVYYKAPDRFWPPPVHHTR